MKVRRVLRLLGLVNSFDALERASYVRNELDCQIDLEFELAVRLCCHSLDRSLRFVSRFSPMDLAEMTLNLQPQIN
jgi:hypothetical protein